MKGRAIAHGAISIVNAISTGKGAALGISLKTEAEVEVLQDSRKIEVEIRNDPGEDDTLVRQAVKGVLERYSDDRYGARVIISSDIPTAKGLKSSSAVSNGVVLATCKALGKKIDDFEAVNLGVDASLKAEVSITGAFDDACASYFGGIFVTDNLSRKIFKSERAQNDLHVVLYVPEKKSYTKDVDKEKLGSLRFIIEEAFSLAAKGEYWKALTINGLIYASALDYAVKPIVDAISAGAIAAGLSGKGPAISALCSKEKVSGIVELWSDLQGQVIKATVNNEKARVMN